MTNERGGEVRITSEGDIVTARKIVRDATVDGYRWSSILAGITASTPFQMKTIVP